MIDVITWLWTPSAVSRSQFNVGHVNTLKRMIERNYDGEFRFSCITDQTKGFHSSIRVIPLWKDHADRESLYGPESPSCYRRLRAYSPEMRELIGPRFISFDLDVVITGPLEPIFERTEDFIIWGDKARRTPYNGSLWAMNAGARAQVWEKFEQRPEYCIAKARSAGYYGTDQAWISYVLGKNEAQFTTADGVYSYRTHVKPERGAMPKDSRIVFFEGHYDPWHPDVQKLCPWVEAFYN